MNNPQKEAVKLTSKIFFFTILFISFIIWKNYIPKESIIGTYENNNTSPILEGPKPIQQGVDRLVLYDDGTFTSRTWGDGTYTLSSNNWEIHLTYEYTFGTAGYHAPISKTIFGKIRIGLNQDLQFYFEKI